MSRPPKPDIRVGDRVEVQVCAWQDGPAGRQWLPTGETFEATVTDVAWDGNLAGGAYRVQLDVNPHHGGCAAKYVRVLDRAAWTEPDLFEVAR